MTHHERYWKTSSRLCVQRAFHYHGGRRDGSQLDQPGRSDSRDHAAVSSGRCGRETRLLYKQWCRRCEVRGISYGPVDAGLMWSAALGPVVTVMESELAVTLPQNVSPVLYQRLTDSGDLAKQLRRLVHRKVRIRTRGIVRKITRLRRRNSTLWGKKTSPFLFFNNSVKNWPILIIFGNRGAWGKFGIKWL